jgi:LPS O-antigen subunit length determinant protein (WzzB/FepE family)
LAKELGIKKNNFKQIDSNDNDKSSSILTFSIADNQKVPDWYLYGEDALLKRIDVLSSRENDNPYVPEIVILQSQLKAISSNQTLKTLENRTDDSPVIDEINKLNIEAIKLKSFKPSSAGINSMQLNQHAFAPNDPIKPNKRLIVSVAAVFGFILSIMLVLLINAFRTRGTS